MDPQVVQIILAAGMLSALFILFLVVSKAAGGIDNSLYKLEYMVRKECDIKLESLEAKYKSKAADRKFDEFYDAKRLAEDIQKASDSNE
jgi:hypothetical protein